tara:strand:- start:69 stop:218 length:150 start_codon:yes stop_codon:yes gene_type:complete
MELTYTQKEIIKALISNLNNGPVGQEALEGYTNLNEEELSEELDILSKI